MRGMEGEEKVDHDNGKFTCDQTEESEFHQMK